MSFKTKNMVNKAEVKRWHVLNSRKNSVAIEELLKMDGMETFVPMRYEKKERNGQVERIYTPAIPGIIFVRERRAVLSEFIKEMWAKEGAKVYFAREHASVQNAGATKGLSARQAFQALEPLIVPDKQMEDFIFVCQQDEDKIRFLQPEEISLVPGDKIRIHGGLFDGREGELIEVKGMKKKQLVVRISDMLAVAAVNIEPKLIEVVEHRNQPEAKNGTENSVATTLTEREVHEYVDSLNELSEKYLLLHGNPPDKDEALVKMKIQLNRLTGLVAKDKFLKAAVYVSLVIGYAATDRPTEMKQWKEKALHFVEKLPESIFKSEQRLRLALALHDKDLFTKAESFIHTLPHPLSIKATKLTEKGESIGSFLLEKQ